MRITNDHLSDTQSLNFSTNYFAIDLNYSLTNKQIINQKLQNRTHTHLTVDCCLFNRRSGLHSSGRSRTKYTSGHLWTVAQVVCFRLTAPPLFYIVWRSCHSFVSRVGAELLGRALDFVLFITCYFFFIWIIFFPSWVFVSFVLLSWFILFVGLVD